MIPPESAGFANLKSKAACCQAATNLVDRDLRTTDMDWL